MASHPIASSRCWPFFHRWAKWKTTDHGKLESSIFVLTGQPHRVDGSPITTGHFEEQRRECEKCGKCQLRIAKS